MMPDIERCPSPCGQHEMHLVTEIGKWSQAVPGFTVEEWGTRPEIWDEGNCEHSYNELYGRIQRAGAVVCEFPLKARWVHDALPHLENGTHRWKIASDLGITRVPVRMGYGGEAPFVSW